MYKFCLFVFIIFCLGGCAFLKNPVDKPVLGEPAKAVFKWLDSIGLNGTITYVDDYFFFGDYTLIIDSHWLESELGDDGYRQMMCEDIKVTDAFYKLFDCGLFLQSLSPEDIYKKIFVKILHETNLEPDDIDLRIRYLSGGRCYPSHFEKIFKINNDGVVVSSKKLPNPPYFVSCMFDALVKFNRATAIKVNKSGMTPPSSFVLYTSGNSILTIIRNKLEQRYLDKKAKIVISGFGDNWLSMRVSEIKNEIIKEKSYWERLQIMIFVESDLGSDKNNLRMIIDGQYGAGFSVPSRQDYEDMEPYYTAELVDYVKGLAVMLAQ